MRYTQLPVAVFEINEGRFKIQPRFHKERRDLSRSGVDAVQDVGLLQGELLHFCTPFRVMIEPVDARAHRV